MLQKRLNPIYSLRPRRLGFAHFAILISINKRGGRPAGTTTRVSRSLIRSFRLGDRTLATAYDFTHDLAARIANRPIQLTTDGHRVYLEAVESAFNEDIDYAMLQKIYRSNPEGESRYSP